MEFERPPEVVDDRHWRFILLVAGGTNMSEAVREVGYKTKNSRSQGYRLGKKYRAVIDGLITKEMEYLESNTHRILAETAALAYATLDNYMRWDRVDVPPIMVKYDDGTEEITKPGYTKWVVTLTDWDEINPADKAVLKSVESKEDGSVKLTLHDKIKPLELLGQHEQLWGNERGEATLVQLIRNYGDADSGEA